MWELNIKRMKQPKAKQSSSASNSPGADNEKQVSLVHDTKPLSEEPVQRGSIIASVVSTLLLRIASRTSFVLLSFYLGAHFTSATVVATVLETFYITELVLSPLVGSFSDRLGRKPFLLAAPVMGCLATSCLLISVLLFPHPNVHLLDSRAIALLLLLLCGRLLEGTTTALNTPAGLGYITDSTIGRDKLRTRMMTAFEVATAGAIALAIPFAGQVSRLLGTWGFFIVIAVHLVNIALIAYLVKEKGQPVTQSKQRVSLFESFALLRHRRILTFLPAWLSINTLVGAWMTLIVIMLTYPNPAADMRHPGQLLYGGFSKTMATSLLGGFGLLLLMGMGVWTLFLPRFRRTTVMSIGLVGLAICMAALTFINGLADNINHLTGNDYGIIMLLLPVLILGVLLLSGFAPAALMQMAAIAETMPGKRGAVMGLYSVVLALGQLLGASLGGMSVDINGFYGLMTFSALLGSCALLSVLYMRMHYFDTFQVISL